MLFLRKIFSLKKRHFPENNFSEHDDILLKYSFFYKQLTFFKQCLLKILLELLPNLCQLITYMAFLLYKICWKEVQNKAICNAMKCKQCCLRERNSSRFKVLSGSNNHPQNSCYLQYCNSSMC